MMKDEKSIAASSQSAEVFVRACPICGAKFGVSLCKICFETFENTPVVGDFSLVICGICGFAFNDFSSLQADFNDYYENDNFYLTSGTISVGGSIDYEEKRLESFAQRLTPYIPSSDSKIIDVGSSRGGLLKLLSQRGFTQLYGVDPNPTCVKFIKEKLGFEAAVGSAQLLPFGDMRGDVLIYSHVIEHVIDLRSLLSVARERLNDGGIICVEVPDASRYQEGSILPFQSLYLEHVNHFSSETLVNYFHEEGFEVVYLELICEKHSSRGTVPCIWAVFRKGDSQEHRNTKGLEIALQNYVVWSNQHPLIEKLHMLSIERTPIYVWGMSYYAMLLLGQTPLRFCNLAGFIDKDHYKQNRKVMKMPIQSPNVLSYVNPGDTVLITAIGYEDQVIEELEYMGFLGNVFKLLEK